MNKYQKQALVDLSKVALACVLALAAVAGIIKLGMTAPDIVAALGFVAMGYCVYQIYLVRVAQLEAEDRDPKQ